MSNHRVGVIGAGFQATNLARAIQQTPGLEVAAISADGRASAAPLANSLAVPEIMTNSALIEDETLPLVIIATPNDHHAALACAALDAGKTVFVEKPVAIDTAGISMLRNRIAQFPGQLIVGHALRTAPGIHKLIRETRTGSLGEIISIEAFRTRSLNLPATSTHWKHDPARTGGELIHEVHELDLICLLGGTISTLHTTTVSPTDPLLTEPAYRHSLIEFRSGAIAHHAISGKEHDSTWSLKVSGTHASLYADLRAGTITRHESGIRIDQWRVFDDEDTHTSLVASSTGPARHNSSSAAASPWMAALARYEMNEVQRILDGRDSILLDQPLDAVQAALTLIDIS